jgi:hypothetical protein
MENQDNQIEREIPKKKATGKVFTESYNVERIERLKHIVHDFFKQGQRKRYCILVDGEMVVSVNSDSRNFDNYKKYLLGNTQSIEVRMFFGNSPNCNRHIFQTNHSQLSGVQNKAVEERIKEALEKQSIENELIHLRKQVKKKNKKLQAFKALQAELDEKQIDLNDLMTKGMELFQLFKGNGNANTLGQTSEPTASVEVEVESSSPTDQYYEQLKQRHPEKTLINVLRTWEVFAKHPELRGEFNQLINQKIKKNEKA